VDPRFAAAASRPIKFIRADVDERGGVAVISVFENDHIFATRVGTCQTQRQLVRFASGIDEITDAQWLRQKTRESLCVAVYIVVEVARVGVEEGDLLLYGTHDARVAVSDERHVVVDVEKGAARVVVEVLHPTANNF
jgi:hypothetical protein